MYFTKKLENPADRIYEIMQSDGRKHYILLDRCKGFSKRRPEWCESGRNSQYPYCAQQRRIRPKTLQDIIRSVGDVYGLSRGVLYPSVCVTCAYKKGYNLNPMVRTAWMFQKKDNDAWKKRIIESGGMTF